MTVWYYVVCKPITYAHGKIRRALSFTALFIIHFLGCYQGIHVPNVQSRNTCLQAASCSIEGWLSRLADGRGKPWVQTLNYCETFVRSPSHPRGDCSCSHFNSVFTRDLAFCKNKSWKHPFVPRWRGPMIHRMNVKDKGFMHQPRCSFTAEDDMLLVNHYGCRIISHCAAMTRIKYH